MSDYPEWPEPHLRTYAFGEVTKHFSAAQMRAYVDADRAMRAPLLVQATHQYGFAQANRDLATINESLDKQLEQVMAERDEFHDWGDKLADAIAAYCAVDIGEHSNLNNPWAKALEALNDLDLRG